MPLGPDDEPEIVIRYRTQPRKKRRVESKLLDDEDSLSKEEVLQSETAPLSGTLEPISSTDEEFFVRKVESLQSTKDSKSKVGLLKRLKSFSENKASEKYQCCSPLVHKIKTMADKHFHPHTLPKSSPKIRRVELKSTDDLQLNEEQKILRLKQSPKASDREIPQYIERRDSDDVLEVLELDESPGCSRIFKETQHAPLKSPENDETFVQEIDDVKQLNVEEVDLDTSTKEIVAINIEKVKPEKAPRKKKEHVYEDIEDYIPSEMAFAEDKSVRAQNEKIKSELFEISIDKSLDESESDTEITTKHLLAPMSSVESASSDEGGRRKPLTPLSEEELTEESSQAIDEQIINVIENDDLNVTEVDPKQTVVLTSSDNDNDKKENEEAVELNLNENEDIAIAENISFTSPKKYEIDPRWSSMK